jgi:hypothetical protein
MKDRVGAMLTLLDHPQPGVALVLLCETSVDELEVTGAGVSVILGREPVGLVASAGVGVGELHDRLVGPEGPAWDAHRTGRPVGVADLATDETWPALREAAAVVGVAAVFAHPLRVGTAGFGGLVLVRDRPGDLSSTHRADAAALADVAALLVLGTQAGANTAPRSDAFEDATQLRAVVHQAAGMVSVQLDVEVADAHVALRAKAWATGTTVDEVARAVVSRRLRFGEDG